MILRLIAFFTLCLLATGVASFALVELGIWGFLVCCVLLGTSLTAVTIGLFKLFDDEYFSD